MKWVLPKTYENPIYPFKDTTDSDTKIPVRHKVIIVGAGPVGLAAALDLAKRGISSVVFSKENTVSIGSRALCFSKKCLEVINRISPKAADRLIDKGVTWNIGKVFYKDDEVYTFNLLAEEGHKIPAFINLQQYYFEEYLVDEAHDNPLIDIRWKSHAHFVKQDDEKVTLKIETQSGNYLVESEYMLACDGVHSPTRKSMNLAFEGELFEENFLIADIVMENDFPTERWFWFDPPFNKGNSALLHKEPDGVWRIDLQLGWDIDKEKELNPERIKERLRKMLGDDCKFELEWTSIYNFRCMRMKKFVHNRIIFAGDSAHQVSPFGARGANSGIQDVDNLIWKLAYHIQGKAPRSILDTYDEERSPATNENIYHSSNATDFISPKSRMSTIFRNAVLDLAKEHLFAQQLVNSGRLSHAYKYLESSLSTEDKEEWKGEIQPGYAVSDTQLFKDGRTTYLIDELGNDFTLLIYGFDKKDPIELDTQLNIKIVYIDAKNNSEEIKDYKRRFKQKYDVLDKSWYLIRPDHYVAARGKNLEKNSIEKALLKSIDKMNEVKKTSIDDKNPLYVKDDMYKILLKEHEGLTEEQSVKMNAKLILLLMNKIDDKDEWSKLVNKARSYEDALKG